MKLLFNASSSRVLSRGGFIRAFLKCINVLLYWSISKKEWFNFLNVKIQELEGRDTSISKSCTAVRDYHEN